MPERPYIPGDDDAGVLKLRAKVWGADHPHTDARYYKWLFQESPDGPGSGIVSVSDGEIIGFAGLVRRKARMGAREFNVAHGLDYMVDPELGGMKSGRIAIRVLQAHIKRGRELGSDFTINYPNDRSIRMLVSAHCGYEIVFEPSLFVRTFGRFRFVATEDGGVCKRFAKTAVARIVSAYSGCTAKRPVSDTEIETIDQFDDRFDKFFDHFSSDGQLRFARDARTLRWRYENHPIYDYRILAATRSGEIMGFVVVSPRHVFDTNAMLMCDLCALGEDTGLAEFLIAAAVDNARQSGSSIVVSQALSSNTSSKALIRSGFIKVPKRVNPKQFRMIAADFTEQGRIAINPSNWFFSWGDTDVV